MTWSDVLAYVVMIAALPLVGYVTYDGVKRLRKFRRTQKLANEALVKAERSDALVVDARVTLELAFQRIKELELENSQLRARLGG